MSNEEKLMQIGRAVVDLQAARTNLAHLAEKLRQIAKTYRQVGYAIPEALDGRKPLLAGGMLITGYGPERAETRLLISEADLIRLLAEYDTAKEATQAAALRLGQLGHIAD